MEETQKWMGSFQLIQINETRSLRCNHQPTANYPVLMKFIIYNGIMQIIN